MKDWVIAFPGVVSECCGVNWGLGGEGLPSRMKEQAAVVPATAEAVMVVMVR